MSALRDGLVQYAQRNRTGDTTHCFNRFWQSRHRESGDKLQSRDGILCWNMCSFKQAQRLQQQLDSLLASHAVWLAECTETEHEELQPDGRNRLVASLGGVE